MVIANSVFMFLGIWLYVYVVTTYTLPEIMFSFCFSIAHTWHDSRAYKVTFPLTRDAARSRVTLKRNSKLLVIQWSYTRPSITVGCIRTSRRSSIILLARNVIYVTKIMWIRWEEKWCYRENKLEFSSEENAEELCVNLFLLQYTYVV